MYAHLGGTISLLNIKNIMTSSNPDSNLWCLTVLPVLQMGSRDSEGEVTAQEPRGRIGGHWDPPTRSDLLVSRAHALELERTK